MPTSVHLWLSDVSKLSRQAQTVGLDWLSQAEQARLQSMGAPHRRAQFIAGHWLLREQLASVAGGSATEWQLTDAADSAPRVLSAPVDATQAHQFVLALSHSGNWIACAVAGTAIGLDIEDATRRRIQIESLAPEVLSPRELQRLQTLPQADQATALRNSWALKEAWLKASEEGISLSRLPQVDSDSAKQGTANACLWSGSQWSLALAMPNNNLSCVDIQHNLNLVNTDAIASHWLVQDQRANTAAR